MKNGRATKRTEPATFGLLANGSCGGWNIDVDETTSGPDRWFMQIQGPSVVFNFQLPSPTVIERIRHHLGAPQPSRGGAGSNGELVIGKGKSVSVRLRRDDEFDDRFFLVFGPADAPVVHYTIAGEDVRCLSAALDQVLEDLSDD
jgi:hypothetical protein